MYVSRLKALREPAGFAKDLKTQCHSQLSFLTDVGENVKIPPVLPGAARAVFR
jgi:hypothetical protein